MLTLIALLITIAEFPKHQDIMSVASKTMYVYTNYNETFESFQGIQKEHFPE